MSVAILFSGSFVFESSEQMDLALGNLKAGVLSRTDFKIEEFKATVHWDGSGPYDFYDETMVELEDKVAPLAIGGSIRCELDGEEVWVPASKPLGYDPGFDRLMRDVIATDWEGVEINRNGFEARFFPDVVKAYKALDTWHQKAALLQLVQDKLSPTCAEIMHDFLTAPPEREHDLIWLSKVVAIIQIEGSFDVWDELFELGNDGVEARAARMVAENQAATS